MTLVAGLTLQRRHMFRDLRPYICTFQGCPKSDYLFGSRHDWFEHETEFHRREWYCSACDDAFPARSAFQNHLQKQHSGSYKEGQMKTVIDRCERPNESKQPCPLCGDKQSAQRLRHHLGGHMQQVALFVPRLQEDKAKGSSDSDSGGVQAGESDEDEKSGWSRDMEFKSNPSDNRKEYDEYPTPLTLLLPGQEERTVNSSHSVEDTELNTNSLPGTPTEKLQQSLEKRKRVLGEEHLSTMASMANLASIYSSQGRWIQAEELQVQVTNRIRMTLGEDHPSTIAAMANLASIRMNREALRTSSVEN